ncbi:hypothetical protein XH99_34410 [Bradyrhizobium nanningense]|uniref:Uncharacterized protein n=1 Tax=Bradyrhizobium nanningense TaxID=1325118 RepID=A0A4Q0RU90_9BRAD|nr:hypothetical protein XH99_34410 [Bradyrhizobium nanningense]RXH28284.1 hypothetical protein XH84_25050 [Bradyrhizobium nanningense]
MRVLAASLDCPVNDLVCVAIEDLLTAHGIGCPPLSADEDRIAGPPTKHAFTRTATLSHTLHQLQRYQLRILVTPITD